jgi:hypothetical protein
VWEVNLKSAKKPLKIKMPVLRGIEREMRLMQGDATNI